MTDRVLLIALAIAMPLALRAACSPRAGADELREEDRKSPPLLAARVEWRDAEGREVLILVPRADGVRIDDAAGAEIARLTVDDDRKIVARTRLGEVLGRIIRVGDRIEARDPEERTTVFELRRQPRGALQVRDGKGALLYEATRRELGVEVEDGAGASLYKVKRRDGGIALRRAGPGGEEEPFLVTRQPFDLTAAACLGFERIPLPVRVALALDVARRASDEPGVTVGKGTDAATEGSAGTGEGSGTDGGQR